MIVFGRKWVPRLTPGDKVEIGRWFRDARYKCASCGVRSGTYYGQDRGPVLHMITVRDAWDKVTWSEWFCAPCVAETVTKLFKPPEGRREAYPLTYTEPKA